MDLNGIKRLYNNIVQGTFAFQFDSDSFGCDKSFLRVNLNVITARKGLFRVTALMNLRG
jgi:hypothetical protein